MKTFILLIAMTVCVTVRGADNQATNAVPDAAEQKRMQMEGIWSEQHGQYGEAAVLFKRLAELHPDDPGIKQALIGAQIKLKASQEDPLTLQKLRLEKTIIPEVSFREAATVDVFEYLRTESAKYTADKTEVNYVWLVPSDMKVGTITLHLHNAPLVEVIRYVTQMVGLTYRVDAHAVVISKAEAASTPAPNAKIE